MLEYFSYKKFKSHKAKEEEAKKAAETTNIPATDPALSEPEVTQVPDTDSHQPLLDKDDEQYFSDLISEAETPVVILEGRSDSPATPLSARSSPNASSATLPQSDDVGGAKAQVVAEGGVEGPKVDAAGESKEGGLKETEESKKVKAKDGKLFSVVERRASTFLASGLDLLGLNKEKVKEDKGKGKEKEVVVVLPDASETEEQVEKKDKGKKKEKKEKKLNADGEEVVDEGVLASVMEKLNLTSINGILVAKSPDIKSSVNKFTQILKDINNGVPTAYNDLIDLFDTSSDSFSRTFDSLPKTIQKFIMRTLPAKMTPEVLRTLAATSPALAAELQSGSALGLKELVTKPGLVASLLKSVVTFLRTRFPLLMGGGMAVSFGITIVMLILWYCYKRGKEVRLEEEEAKNAFEAEAKTEGETSQSPSGVRTEPANDHPPPPPQPLPRRSSFERDIGHSDTPHETGP